MRIRSKLLLTFLGLLGLVAILAGLFMPRLAEKTVIRAERDRLTKQADKVATNLVRQMRSRRLDGPVALLNMAEFLYDDAVVLVDTHGTVLKASPSRAELEGKQLPLRRIIAQAEDRHLFGQSLTEVPGVGQYLLAASQMQGEGSRGIYVIMIRDVQHIQELSRPITVLLIIIISLVLAAALVVSGWLSREMVGRLRSTGEAARALADGELDRRAPVHGKDEIADLAAHFNHMAQRIEKLVDGLRKSEGLRKDLLVTVSHELRTPMTSIAGFAEALRDGVVRDEAQKQRYYSIIANESARLNRLINDVFAVAKLEAGQIEIRLQAMSVAQWLLDAADGFSPMAQSSGARLEVQISPEAERARIYGDRDRLDQVVGNLLSNALRYTPAGEAVTIRSLVEADEVVVEVTDKGPGLPPGDAERVFERFYQGSDKGSGNSGAGLGLAIVKSLVEAHGGRVGVTSRPGAGATFWLRLKHLEA